MKPKRNGDHKVHRKRGGKVKQPANPVRDHGNNDGFDETLQRNVRMLDAVRDFVAFANEE